MYHRRYMIVLVAMFGLLLGPLARPTAARTAPPPVAPTISSPSLHSDMPTTVTATAPLGIAPAATTCAPGSGTGSISGTVRAPTTTPIQNVLVVLYEADSGRAVKVKQTTNAGTYSFTDLAAGRYLIQFDTHANGLAYAGEWYNDQAGQASAMQIDVAEGSALTGIDATLVVGAQITGKVIAGDTGNPLPNTAVTIYDSNHQSVGGATTNASGVYTATGLPSGSYTVLFDLAWTLPYQSEYYNDKPDAASATRLTLAAPQIRTGVDAVLARGAQIAGRVTAADTGLGLPNMVVDIYSSGGRLVNFANTDSAGYYTTTAGLASDTYRLAAGPLSETSDYLPADRTVSVSAPNILEGVDIALATGGQVTGRVTNAAMAPLPFVSVFITDEANTFQRTTLTDAAGRYTIHGVPSGSYLVFFNHASYIGEYYNNQAGSAQADRIEVTAPQAASGIDAVMARGGAISGRVTAADTGLGLGDVHVLVFDLAGNPVHFATTSASGNYALTTALPSGIYRVQFVPNENGSACAYLSEFYNNRRTAASADPVSVGAPNTTPAINAELERGSMISGRVTAQESGSGLRAVYAAVYNSAGEVVALGQTNLSGIYRAKPALPSGTYRVGFFPSGGSPYLAEYAHDKPALSAADPISLVVPNDTTGIDAALLRANFEPRLIYLPSILR